MNITELLLVKLAPLYILIFLGFIAAKFLKVDRDHVASLVIYIIIPIVFAGSLWQTDLNFNDTSVPLVIFGLALTISAISYCLGHVIYGDTTKNLLASGMPTGNTGYFGIPIAAALFDSQVFGLYILVSVTSTMYQVTFSYYFLAVGSFDWKTALKKLLSLPPLYAAIVGIALSLWQVPVPQIAVEMTDNFKAALSILGMMIIGLALASLTKCSYNPKFLSLAMGIRFIIWPIIGLGLVFLDQNYFGFLSPDLHKIVMLFSVLPIAADFVIYAANMNLHPQKAALAVLLSTIIAAFSIPTVYVFLLQ